MSSPLLSVLLTNYNHAAYVGEALAAILAQDYRQIEVIVVDDGSTDQSLAVIGAIAQQDPRVIVLPNGENRGVLLSIERALSQASGDYFYWAAADDRVLPGLFAKSMALLTQYPQAALCFADIAFLDAQTGALHNKHLGFSQQSSYFDPDQLVERIRQTDESIPGYTAIFKKTALLEAGKFLSDLRWHTDWFALLCIAFRYGACYIPEPLAAYRFLPNSFSSGHRDWPTQRSVLSYLFELLQSSPYQDISPRFQRSGIMGKFGLQVVRLALQDPRYRHWLTRLPYGKIVIRECKNLLIDLGSPQLRQMFWQLRNHYQLVFKR